LDTFSANSLKILDKDPETFKLKYGDGLFLYPDNSNTKAGQDLHSFLCFYLKGFDMGKIEASFSKKDREFIENIKEFDTVKLLKKAPFVCDGAKDDFIKNIEQPFLIKCKEDNSAKDDAKAGCFYLTGRFDAILHSNDEVQIYDWKTVNLPKDPKTDIQTVVYLYSASKLYKTENVSLTYVSLSKNESVKICFNREQDYFKRIFEIVRKVV